MDPTLPSAADLDPAVPGDVDAIRRLLEGGSEEQLPDDAFLARVSAESPCERLRGEAQLMRGMLAQSRGDIAMAVDHFTGGLRTTWGSGGSIERRAVINYSIVCINQKRALETMLLARRGLAIGADDDFLGAVSALNLAGALITLGDAHRAVELLRTVDRTADRLAGVHRRYVDFVRHIYWMGAACETGDAERARTSLRAVEADEEQRLPLSSLRAFRAQVAYSSNDLDDAMRTLQQVRAMDEPWSSMAASCDLLEVRVLLQLGQREQALAAAARLVDRLEDASSDAIAPGNRLETARVLAADLRDDPDAADLARRALAVAAAAAMERIWQADRFRRDLPGFEFLTGEDRRAIDEYRARFARDFRDVLAEVARLLASHDELARIRTPDASPEQIGVCAWCRRIRGPEGLWLDFGDVDPPCGSVRVTHGACEPCLEDTLAAIAARP